MRDRGVWIPKNREKDSKSSLTTSKSPTPKLPSIHAFHPSQCHHLQLGNLQKIKMTSAINDKTFKEPRATRKNKSRSRANGREKVVIQN